MNSLAFRLARAALLAAIVLAPDAARAASATDAPPVYPKGTTTDTYWGVTVDDPYRSLENLKDPNVVAWFHGQGDYAKGVLSRIPGRDEMLQRLQELDAGRPFRIFDIVRLADGRLFYQRINAGENLARLCTRPRLDGDETVLVDPATIPAPDGGHTSLVFHEPSADGRRVLYGTAPSGSEQTTLHVLDTSNGTALPDSIDRLEDGYTPPLWLADGTGFVYSRRQLLSKDAPETDGYKNSRAYVHRLGDAVANDPLVFGRGVWPNVAMTDVDFPSVVLTPGSKWAIGKIKHGDINQLTLYAAKVERAADLVPAAGRTSPWTPICDLPDSVVDFAVHGDWIDLVTSRDAPRYKVVRTSLAHPDFAHAEVLVPAGNDVVNEIFAASDGLYVGLSRGGASRVERIAWTKGAKRERLTLPDGYPSATISSAGPDVPGAIVLTAAWTRAGRLFGYDPAKGQFADTRLTPPGKYDAPTDFVSEEVEAPAADGTMVPLSIVHRKDVKLDGSNPTLLTGYGSYGSSQNVSFSATRLAWLEKGGVYAVAHVRGGGENGEAWHVAGQKLNKPNTWNDFIACGEYLIAKGYTRPDRLAGQGGSAGGILIGRALTERPDLFAAAIVDVGSLDCVRMETTMNGVPNIPEFGTVTKADEFKGLLAMSSYHHVVDGTNYPAVLLTAGMNDPRVEPWESAKMTARLQAASASGKPVLFRVEYGAGHGIGSTKRQTLEGLADKYSFLMWQLGMTKPAP